MNEVLSGPCLTLEARLNYHAMSAPPKRVFARYPCLLPARVAGPKGILDATVLNFGMGGVFVQVKGELSNTPVKIEMRSGRDLFLFDARIVRIAGRDPYDSTLYLYGLYFLASGRTEQKARLLLDRIRQDRTQ